MDTLSNLESFVSSAELRSFSAAARRLGLTPAAVSRNVAHLERQLGVRLFERSTRRVTPTEAGDRLLARVATGLSAVQSALADASEQRGEAAGVLRLSVAPGFGVRYVLPLLPGFLQRHPGITHDWQFDNQRTEFGAQGLDVAIGGGFPLSPGFVARPLVPVHGVVVASPACVEARPDAVRRARKPAEAAGADGVAARSPQSGRLPELHLRTRGGTQGALPLRPRVILNDPDAVCQAALLGMGVALLSLPHALPHLETGALQRLLPAWYADIGTVSLYFSGQRLLPAKTRVFVDHVVDRFREADLYRRLSAA